MNQIEGANKEATLQKKNLSKKFRKTSSEIGEKITDVYQILFQGEVTERELHDLGYEDDLEETRKILLRNCKVLEMVLEDWMKKNGLTSVDQLISKSNAPK